MGYFNILMGTKVCPIKALMLSTFCKRIGFFSRCYIAIAHHIYIFKNTKENVECHFFAFYSLELAENLALASIDQFV